jgi:hypothetical protein
MINQGHNSILAIQSQNLQIALFIQQESVTLIIQCLTYLLCQKHAIASKHVTYIGLVIKVLITLYNLDPVKLPMQILLL